MSSHLICGRPSWELESFVVVFYCVLNIVNNLGGKLSYCLFISYEKKKRIKFLFLISHRLCMTCFMKKVEIIMEIFRFLRNSSFIILTLVKLILEFVKVLIYLLSKFSMFIQDMKTLPI